MDRRDLLRLARLACQSEDPTLRGEAWQGLLPEVQVLAAQVARRFSPPVQRDVMEDGPSHLFAKMTEGKFDPEGGNFLGWAKTVLFNYAITRNRKQSAASLDERIEAGLAPTAAEVNEDHAALPRRRAAEVLRLLGDIDWPMGGRQQTDFFAVFLLNLRLAAALRGRFRLVGGRPSDEGLLVRLPELVALYIPWSEKHQERCCQDGWPPLSEIWADLATRLTQPPYTCRAEQVCESVTRLTGGRVTLGIDRWNKLGQRARAEARRQISARDSTAWDRCLIDFFPETGPAREDGSSKNSCPPGRPTT